MHDHAGLSAFIQYGLAVFYFLVMLMNLGFVAYYRPPDNRKNWHAGVWVLVAMLFLVGFYLWRWIKQRNESSNEPTTQNQ